MKFLHYILLVLISNLAIGQVGIGTTTPNSSAALDITSNESGLLIPRLTEAQKLSIASPATGLLIFQTDTASGFWYFNGTIWTPFASSGDNWALTTNLGTTPTINKLGTLDNNPLIIKTNNQEAVRVTASGNTGINTTTPNSKLTVVSSISASYTQNFESLSSPSNVSLSNVNNPYSFNSNNPSCVASDGWRIATNLPLSTTCAGCTGKRAIIDYGASSCTFQDATLVVKIGSFAEPYININFNYGYNYFNIPDSFTIELYNETTNASVEILALHYTSANSQTFSRDAAIIPGNNYSLRYRFVGSNNSYGAVVDNIVVTPINPAVRIEDGSQNLGYVLISDANGNATWTSPSTPTNDDDWRFNSGSTQADPIYRIGNTKVGYLGTARSLLDIYNNQNSGTQVGIGSNEFITDELNEFLVSTSIIPSLDNSFSIGRSALRWREIYATNGVITTSDIREKENILPLGYGISELKNLKPVSYYWKNEEINSINKKIGFIAQELQDVLPETVQNKEWQIENNQLIKKDTDNLCVSYSEILPVVVKSIQEHQSTLKNLEQEIDALIALTKNQN